MLTRCAPFGPATFSRRTRAVRARFSQLTYCATSFARLRFDFRTLLPPLLEDAVHAHVSGEFSREVGFARALETGWAAVGAPRGGVGTTAGVLHIPPQALVVYPPIAAVLVNALVAALNRLQLLAPVPLLGKLANVLDASLVKAFGTLLEAPRAEAAEVWGVCDGVFAAAGAVCEERNQCVWIQRWGRERKGVRVRLWCSYLIT